MLKTCGKNCVIVFDGYPDESTTKDTTHIRRKSTKAGRFVNITSHMKFNMSKKLFLSVLKYKNHSNAMLTQYINDGNTGLIKAIQENGDAHYLIVKTAVERSNVNDIVVISVDTDVLVLLLYLQIHLVMTYF